MKRGVALQFAPGEHTRLAMANALAGDDALDSAERRPPAGLAIFVCGLVLGGALGISLAAPTPMSSTSSSPPAPLCSQPVR